MNEIEKWDWVSRIEPEPENDGPGLMRAFDELVTGPVHSVHIERMDDGLYWIGICRNGQCQRIVIGSATGRAKIVARTEMD